MFLNVQLLFWRQRFSVLCSWQLNCWVAGGCLLPVLTSAPTPAVMWRFGLFCMYAPPPVLQVEEHTWCHTSGRPQQCHSVQCMSYTSAPNIFIMQVSLVGIKWTSVITCGAVNTDINDHASFIYNYKTAVSPQRWAEEGTNDPSVLLWARPSHCDCFHCCSVITA